MTSRHSVPIATLEFLPESATVALTSARRSSIFLAMIGIEALDVDKSVDLAAMWAETCKLVRDRHVYRKVSSAVLSGLKVVVEKRETDRFVRWTPKGWDDSCPPKASSSPQFVVSNKIAVQQTALAGKAFVARDRIPGGTTVLVEKPFVSVLDVEYKKKSWSGVPGADTAAVFEALGKLWLAKKPAEEQIDLKAVMMSLHPENPTANPSTMEPEAGEAVVSSLAGLGARVDIEAFMSEMEPKVRLNALGFYTGAEQLCYTKRFSRLTGTGLYALGSRFNHSCCPNVGRHSMGDVTIFRVIKDVEPGTELCINYIESYSLASSAMRRSKELNRDFTCGCERCTNEVAINLEDDKSFDRLSETDRVIENHNLEIRLTVRAKAVLQALSPHDRLTAGGDLLQGLVPCVCVEGLSWGELIMLPAATTRATAVASGDISHCENQKDVTKYVKEVVEEGDGSEGTSTEPSTKRTKRSPARPQKFVLAPKDAQRVRISMAMAQMEVSHT